MDNMDKTPFDDLLNEAFLNSDFEKPEGIELLNTVAESVLGEVKITLLKPSLFQQLKGLLGNSGLIIISSIIVLTTSWLGLKAIEESNQITYIPRESVFLSVGEENVDEIKTVHVLEPLDTKSFKIIKKQQNSFNKPISAELLIPVLNYEIPYLKIDSSEDEEVYRFPVLTPEEITANRKRKETMLKSLLKLEKDKYAEIDVKKQVKNSHAFVMKSFYMRTSEVTNIEYKTFLFDILLQRRKDDFLIAKPKQDEWLSLDNSFKEGEGMKDLYFSHPAYDNYPVVNVSRAGVEMYCQWLINLVNKSSRNKNRIQGIRLPYSFEWEYAASGGNEKNQYAWGGPYLRNSEGCFLANYQPLKNEPNADGGLYTVTAESYSQNYFGLYNMNGNVAEMITYFKEDTIHGTKGGSFKDIAKYIQNNSPDLNRGIIEPKPYIGFRPIVLCYDKTTRLVGTILDNSKLNIVHREENFKENEKRVIGFWDRHINYSVIEGGNFNLNEKELYVMPFFIQTTEVTNANFKQFIEYLERESKFILSQQYTPDGSQWDSAPIEEYYYTHPAYAKYPVVNISREAAISYCQWLEDELNEQEQFIAERDNVKAIKVSVSLPSNVEWIAAASNMGKYNDYPWHSTLRNNGKKYEGQYMANFKHSKKETSDNILAGTLNDNAELTAPVYSYWPNTLGIYNMGGNVAEMVYYEDGSIGAKGGSWNKAAKEMLIHAEDPFIGFSKPHKEIGFRPVIRIVQ